MKERPANYTFFRIEKPGYLMITRNRIGLQEAESFRKELVDYLKSYKKNITLNSSSLDDLDCAGIAVIIRAEAEAAKRGLYIRLEGLKNKPRHVAEITKTLDVLEHPERYY
ncbi:MAG: STAS domain-containing protein [Nanoarchaeota archaeon]